MISIICGMKKKKAHRYKEQIGGSQRLGLGEMGEGGQNIQTSSYKIIKSWGCKIQHVDYS